MKKLTALMLALILALSLAACGGGSKAEEPAPETTEAPAEETTSEDNDKTASAGDEGESKPSISSKSENAPAPAEATELNETLVDNDDVIVTLTGIEPDGKYGYTWKIYIENKSPDRDIYVTADDVSVNGLMLNPYFYETVTAGSKLNTEMYWYTSDFEFAEITDVTMVEFTLDINDDDTYDDIFEDTYTIYPQGEDAYVAYSPNLDDGLLLEENDDFTLYLLWYNENADYGYTLYFYVINNSDRALTFDMDDTTMNGYMNDSGWWYETVPAGRAALSQDYDVYFSDEFMETNNISTVESFGFPLEVRDEDYNTIFDDTFSVSTIE